MRNRNDIPTPTSGLAGWWMIFDYVEEIDAVCWSNRELRPVDRLKQLMKEASNVSRLD